MKKTVLMATLSMRKLEAIKVQETLTKYGCLIKTRLGLHGGDNECSDCGLIILELKGSEKEFKKLDSALKKIKGVKTKLVSLSC
jgi:hypothetical protein